MRFFFLALFIAAAAPGCCADTKAEVDLKGITCRDRPDDDTGHLETICEYIVDHSDTYPINPNQIEAERVVAGDKIETKYYGDIFATERYTYVFLNCCYTGDYAVVDEETGEVVAFALGAV